MDKLTKALVKRRLRALFCTGRVLVTDYGKELGLGWTWFVRTPLFCIGLQHKFTNPKDGPGPQYLYSGVHICALPRWNIRDSRLYWISKPFMIKVGQLP